MTDIGNEIARGIGALSVFVLAWLIFKLIIYVITKAYAWIKSKLKGSEQQ